MVFLETKNGKPRRHILVAGARSRPRGPAASACARFHERRDDGSLHHERSPACVCLGSGRAGIRTGDVTLHMLRHTALSRTIEKEFNDQTVMAIGGHTSTRMLARYTHPSEERRDRGAWIVRVEVFGHKPVTIGE